MTSLSYLHAHGMQKELLISDVYMYRPVAGYAKIYPNQ